MCLIAFDHRPGEAWPLRLVANRDEFHARPAAPLACWADDPAIVGGRDLEAGGSWLAVHRRGRFAAVTNVRDPRLKVAGDAPSRGDLVRDALTCPDLPAWLDRLAGGEAARFAGFNLLAGDGSRLWHLHRGVDGVYLAEVPPGLHGVSNGSLNTPWPKLIEARQGLGACLRHGRWPEDALTAMADPRPADDDQLPETGVGLEMERMLSSPFIVGERYGTRAMTWVGWHASGRIEIGERRFGPGGVALGESVERLTT
ncbi:NRDE family protein [Halomonas sp.]|uniref:NRDE family protein n=2 Tax=Halomonas sp. TaxID=1486246 RepID=UPI0025BA1694|nr:NRDE family protein [Halomonas sp.]